VTILIMSVPSVLRPPAVLVPGGSLLTAITFGVLNVLGSVSGVLLLLLVAAGVLGEVIVWFGFAGIRPRQGTTPGCPRLGARLSGAGPVPWAPSRRQH
jgi:hypothetical protein